MKTEHHKLKHEHNFYMPCAKLFSRGDKVEYLGLQYQQ